MAARSSVLVAPGEGEVVLQGGVGVIRKISAASDGAFSVVEHPLEPGALAAPPHTHADVDEYSFVIEGEIGVLMGEETFRAPAGSYVLMARRTPHVLECGSGAGEGLRDHLACGLRAILRRTRRDPLLHAARTATRLRKDHGDGRQVRHDLPHGADGGNNGEARRGATLAGTTPVRTAIGSRVAAITLLPEVVWAPSCLVVGQRMSLRRMSLRKLTPT
jgi:quercetin dioxygenase-like cupin family protein